MARYKNKLGLSGIPRIEELCPEAVSFFEPKTDEFIHIAETLKGWKRIRKSLADCIEDEEHRNALLADLYSLRDWIALELRAEQRKPPKEQSLNFIERRDYFLTQTVPYEESQLLAWEAPIVREIPFDFVKFRGCCFLTYQQGAAVKLRLELEESGLFSLYWKDAGHAGKASEPGEPIAKEIKLDSGKTRNFNFANPKRNGTIYIHNHTRKVLERVPL